MISKLLQRIIKTRLNWYLEVKYGIAETQEAYRKDRSCNDVIMRLGQFIQEGWNSNKTTVLCILDFKSFFETIWRNNFYVKLYRKGIKGKILKMIMYYLNNRKFRFQVNSHTTDWQSTNVGVQQGGICSSIFSNVYSSDADPADYSLHSEFADDNIKWEADINIKEANDRLQIRLNNFHIWCTNNNLQFDMSKVKIMFFRPPCSPRPFNKFEITFGGNMVQEVEIYKILGTTIDINLSFDDHFVRVIKSAYRSFQVIKSFTLQQYVLRQQTIVNLYKALIRPKLDFSIAANQMQT